MNNNDLQKLSWERLVVQTGPDTDAALWFATKPVQHVELFLFVVCTYDPNGKDNLSDHLVDVWCAQTEGVVMDLSSRSTHNCFLPGRSTAGALKNRPFPVRLEFVKCIEGAVSQCLNKAVRFPLKIDGILHVPTSGLTHVQPARHIVLEDEKLPGIDMSRIHHVLQRQLPEELALAHLRYEAVRKLTPAGFKELCDRNLHHGMPFDRAVDALAGIAIPIPERGLLTPEKVDQLHEA